MCGYKIAEPIEPLDVRLEIACLLHVLEGRLYVGILFCKSLNKLFWPDKRKSFELNMRQLLGEHKRIGAHFCHVSLLIQKENFFYFSHVTIRK